MDNLTPASHTTPFPHLLADEVANMAAAIPRRGKAEADHKQKD